MTDSYHFRAVRYAAPAPGPKLIVTGSVHGNETCGTQGISRVLADLDAGRLSIVAGQVTFVPVTNPKAYANGTRNGDRNLNRNLTPTAEPKDFEDQVANWLCPLLAEHEVLLDLHSTRALNPAFAMLGPLNNDGPLQPFKHAEKERSLALRLGTTRFVDGWLDAYAIGVARRRAAAAQGSALNPLNTDPRYGVGTTEYMRSVGGYAITLECGQHDAPDSPLVAYKAIINTLAWLGISNATPPSPVDSHESLSLFDVIDRYHEQDRFVRSWVSFDRVRSGEPIGTRADGTVVSSPVDGYIVFPDANSVPGNEWFYLARINPTLALA